jgi:hypothetical protein
MRVIQSGISHPREIRSLGFDHSPAIWSPAMHGLIQFKLSIDKDLRYRGTSYEEGAEVHTYEASIQ